ncbi:U-box domain-containing protein 10 [Hibiscus syriacus]|uniref:RING-type E3 ubiquitin transferase n=1 Tax=Hibiscus syriacus TaxID=106335 RepID=A0A6A2Y540_HIBSY|nr:U-box domain-containing protein 11-like [Hibiscus syriacus]KAE8663874.1 U-box domain-containing protein 10 [Hibiscus syriacus]
MAGVFPSSSVHGGYASPAFLLRLVLDIVSAGTARANAVFKKDCTNLVGMISVITHLLEETKGFLSSGHDRPSSSVSWLVDLEEALQSAQRLLSVASAHHSDNYSDEAAKRVAYQFQCVTCKLETALGKIPCDQFHISEEVQEQVAMVRGQLRRAAERYRSLNLPKCSDAESRLLEKECAGTIHGTSAKVDGISENSGTLQHAADKVTKILERVTSSSSNSTSLTSSDVCLSNELDPKRQENMVSKGFEETKKPDALVIPDDFICPISLELMRDPVVVATGQTYERSYIQRWIDCGNATCPITRQNLEDTTLTPNYVLRSLINQWCAEHNIEQPSKIANGRLKKSDGSFHDISCDKEAIKALVCKLSRPSIVERKAAVAEIRSLSKSSMDNRILIADAGAIPVLVNLLKTADVSLQEHAVTSILNLSIFDNNKSLIMLTGALPSIVQVLEAGSVEARENAAATLFSLSLVDENKLIIGSLGAIPALVDLLQHGRTRGKKDAAIALFSLCLYQVNKGRAVKAGIIAVLLEMLSETRNVMVDEALTIFSVLASNHEAKSAMVKAKIIPVLVDFLRTGSPKTKENAAATLLPLCMKDAKNLACIIRLGADLPLSELTKRGTERAKRKATSLLEYIRI